MRSLGDILLVSCYELGHQPLALASPLAMLSEAGFQPVAVDTSVSELSDRAIVNARLVAISAPMHTAMRLGEQVARRVRRVNPAAHVVFYGLYAWLNAEHLLDNQTSHTSISPLNEPAPPGCRALADSVVGGEFEQPLLNLAQALSEGRSGAPGVRFAGITSEPLRERTRFVIPRRELLPGLERYAGLQTGSAVDLAGYVETTRGCKHTCLHCPITPVYGGRFVAVPSPIVLADIRNQAKAGARHITFGDPDFFNGPTHSLRILRAMHAEFPDLTFDATIKVEHLLAHRHILPDLKEFGCVFVVSAIESLSDVVLRRLRKGHTRAEIETALDLMNAAHIPLRPSLVSFTPWTTLADQIDLLHWIEQRGLIDAFDPVQLAIRLLVPPGSALLGEPETANWIGELDVQSYSYRWRHPDPRMDDLHQQIALLVNEGERQQRDPVDTFALVKRASYRMAGLPKPRRHREALERWIPPKLTESWFC